MNKKANMLTPILVIALIAGMAIFLLIVGYIGTELATQLEHKLNDTPTEHFASINSSLQSTVNIASNMLGVIWYIVFGGLVLATLVSAWFTRTYPVFLPVFFILLVVSVIVGVAMSNAYYELSQAATFTTAAAQQSNVAFMMNKLPYIALVIGIVSIIVMFIKPKEEPTAIM